MPFKFEPNKRFFKSFRPIVLSARPFVTFIRPSTVFISTLMVSHSFVTFISGLGLFPLVFSRRHIQGYGHQLSLRERGEEKRKKMEERREKREAREEKEEREWRQGREERNEKGEKREERRETEGRWKSE